MAAKATTGSSLRKPKISRRGIHSKRGSSKNKGAQLYKKPNVGQG